MNQNAGPVTPIVLKPPLKVITTLEKSAVNRTNLEELAAFLRSWLDIADLYRTASVRDFQARCAELIEHYESRIHGLRSAVKSLPKNTSRGHCTYKDSITNSLHECWTLLCCGPTYIPRIKKMTFRALIVFALLLLAFHQVAIVSSKAWAVAQLGLGFHTHPDLAWLTGSATLTVALVAGFTLNPSFSTLCKWGLVAGLCIADWVFFFPHSFARVIPTMSVVGFIIFAIVQDRHIYRGSNTEWDDQQRRTSLRAAALHISRDTIPCCLPEMLQQSDVVRDKYIWNLLRAAHDNSSQFNDWLIQARSDCRGKRGGTTSAQVRQIELATRKEIIRTFAGNETDLSQTLSLETFDGCLAIIFTPVLCEYETLDPTLLTEFIVAILACIANENRLYKLYADHEVHIQRLYSRRDLREEVKRIAYSSDPWSDRDWCLHFLRNIHPLAIEQLRKHVEQLIAYSGPQIAAASELERRSRDAVREYSIYLRKVADEPDVSDQEKLDEWVHLYHKYCDAAAPVEIALGNLPENAGHLSDARSKRLTKGSQP